MKGKTLLSSTITFLGLYSLLFLFLSILAIWLNWNFEFILIISVIVLLLEFILSPWLMDLTLKIFYKIDYKHEIPTYLKKYIEKICNDNKMKFPKIGIVNDGAPNAFTYGRGKNDARIVLTKGIYELLDEEEVKAVVSHEIGHTVHYDAAFMTAAQLIPIILLYIYDTSINSTKDDSDEAGAKALIGIIAYVLYVIAQYIVLWLSRTREYYADEFACIQSKNPNALASALVKIGYGLTTSLEKNTKGHISSVSALGIFDSKTSKSLVINSAGKKGISKENIKKAARWELWNPWAKWYEFNSTHPLISKRLKAICNYSKEYNQKPYIIFDEKQPESYVNDVIAELFIATFPIMILIYFIIVGIFAIEFIKNMTLFIAIGSLLFTISLFLYYGRTHKNRKYNETTISDLLSEVKVSGITSIPCTITGKIIGKGDPGCILSEDFVLQDKTGIIKIDYNQPLPFVNIIFALLKSKKYIGKEITIKGWYRRSPIPYIEIKNMIIDGKKKRCLTYYFTKTFLYLMLVASIVTIYFAIK